MLTLTNLRAIVLVLLLSLTTSIGATPQQPDSIILDGVPAPLTSGPLAQYLADHPDASSDLQSTVYVSSISRGYVCTWEISDKHLVLRKIDVLDSTEPENDEEPKLYLRNTVGKVFPNADTVVAKWYSGALVIPRGKLLLRDRMHTNSVYEGYAIVSIRKGQVIGRLDFEKNDFEAFKTTRFELFKQTAQYAADVKKTKLAEPQMAEKDAEMAIAFTARELYLSADFETRK